jgi:hypothetical protein
MTISVNKDGRGCPRTTSGVRFSLGAFSPGYAKNAYPGLIEIVDGFLRREPSIDFLSGFEADLYGVPDPDVLTKAADEGRVLVTHDQRTMLSHFAGFIPRRQSPGVFIIPQRLEIGAAIDELLLIWSASDSEEWTKLYCVFAPLDDSHVHGHRLDSFRVSPEPSISITRIFPGDPLYWDATDPRPWGTWLNESDKRYNRFRSVQ